MNTKNELAMVGFIGLGRMGLPMVENLLKSGFSVQGFDQSEAARAEVAAAGATACSSAKEAARGADVVITMLPNGSIVREVLLGEAGIADALSPGAIIIDMSSSAPTDTTYLSEQLLPRGFRVVDAPVSGGRKRAVDGTLTIMAGGEPTVIDAILPVLEAMSAKIFRTGKIGSGHAMKAINNYVSGAGMVAAMEGVILGETFGLEPEVIVDVLNVSTGRNNTTEVKMKQFVLNRDFGSGFALGLMAKDIGIANDLAEALNLQMGSLAETSVRWKAAQDRLGPDADHTEIYRFLADS
ncbi:NAD(P)-dependent oxidoreductase [Salipiger mangrovisoli]|uniref:NAD(P)-dependent oxidoreductase n=1 Tax=Salipiger mangrovisoli TaxID=2865933 RepID=A0ABR9X119_9RHOB|nr:NAD(P)-dependent oxidoreductase [Salipiger mangrovisoli]MBE9637238.1 NAD(P)-dependent oxidoreductase [Salipiger mangrovisoli]